MQTHYCVPGVHNNTRNIFLESWSDWFSFHVDLNPEYSFYFDVVYDCKFTGCRFMSRERFGIILLRINSWHEDSVVCEWQYCAAAREIYWLDKEDTREAELTEVCNVLKGDWFSFSLLPAKAWRSNGFKILLCVWASEYCAARSLSGSLRHHPSEVLGNTWGCSNMVNMTHVLTIIQLNWRLFV